MAWLLLINTKSISGTRSTYCIFNRDIDGSLGSLLPGCWIRLKKLGPPNMLWYSRYIKWEYMDHPHWLKIGIADQYERCFHGEKLWDIYVYQASINPDCLGHHILSPSWQGWVANSSRPLIVEIGSVTCYIRMQGFTEWHLEFPSPDILPFPSSDCWTFLFIGGNHNKGTRVSCIEVTYAIQTGSKFQYVLIHWGGLWAA